MAPAKRKPQQHHSLQTTATSSVRVTRAAAKRAADDSLSASVAELPEKNAKKPKVAGKGKQKQEKAEEKPEADSGNAVNAPKKTIVIEHCKQCNSFKTRANLVKEGLEKSVTGITVIVNPEKPRRGCFEIREEGGEKFISLLSVVMPSASSNATDAQILFQDMKRPFTPMKKLDMDKVIADIIDMIN